MQSHLNKVVILIIAIFLIACQPAVVGVESELVEVQVTATQIQIQTVAPTATPIPVTPTPVLIDQVCSPLEGDSIAELEEIITQPFKAPRPGQDDGHHGVDFAYFRRKDRLSVDGVPVLAALPGTVVTVLNNRWPYGNAIMIETPLNQLSPSLPFMRNLPARLPTVAPDPKMGHCQSGELSFELSATEESLYTFYAHFQDPPDLKVGDEVACGQPIGKVGNTGDSSNPHLHFETRIGPAGARFESMAYYILDATEAERYNYCVWRVTNLFQAFDAMMVFAPSFD